MKRLSLLIATMTLALCANAGAQQRDTIFLHGLASSPDVWKPTVDRLSTQLAMRPFIPPLNWRVYYESQAAQLQSQLGRTVSADVVTVGHSNGGVVARHWTRVRPLGSIITLGSPNQGAPFVDHIFDWFTFLDDIFVRMSNVYNVFYQIVNPETWWWVPSEWRPLFEAATDFWSTTETGLLSLGFDLKFPVLSEMRVWSPFMRNLNSPSNLNREAIQVPHRAAVLSSAGDFDHGGPFRIIKPDSYENWHNGLIITGVSVDALAFIIRILADPWDYAAFELADHLSTVAEWALQFEEVWCRSVSDPSPLYLGRCYEHDGIVPVWSQIYDYPRVQFFLMQNGPIHTQEVAQSDDTLYVALTNVAQIPPLPPIEPPPPPVEPPGFGSGRFIRALAGCTWDATSVGLDECVPPAKGAFKLDTQGACYSDGNADPPDQCIAPMPILGRYKADVTGACRWDSTDSGPNQCVP